MSDHFCIYFQVEYFSLDAGSAGVAGSADYSTTYGDSDNTYTFYFKVSPRVPQTLLNCTLVRFIFFVMVPPHNISCLKLSITALMWVGVAGFTRAPLLYFYLVHILILITSFPPRQDATNLALFEADPTAYLPQYGGFCSWGIAEEEWWTADTLGPNANPDVWEVLLMRFSMRSIFLLWKFVYVAGLGRPMCLLKCPHAQIIF